MHVLLDECLPRHLKTAIIGHDVSTVPEMGWAGLPDREVLERASAQFDVFITVDRVMFRQPPLVERNLGIMVLIAPSNRLVDLLALVPKVHDALKTIQAGQIIRVQSRVRRSNKE